MQNRKTAGEIQRKILQDETPYNYLEVAHALSDDIYPQLLESIKIYHNRIEEDEFCVVRVKAEDPLLKTVQRYKYYCWPYLPEPRPNQAVFLYNKPLDLIKKRLWVLPDALTMAKLATDIIVPDTHKTMQAWSIAFFEGRFFEYIRYEHGINMLSYRENYDLVCKEMAKAGIDFGKPAVPDPFDFSKITIENIVDTQKASVQEASFCSNTET